MPGATAWSTEMIELDEPGPLEVRVRIEAAGLCHSDAHLISGGYAGIRRPIVGGHEGAGVVEAVGPGVSLVAPGDHVVLAFMPSCGMCHSCVNDLGHLCERGRFIGEGFQVADGTSRHHLGADDLSLFCLMGAFASHTVVHESSCVRIDPALPFEQASLLGCSGVTGWGSAVRTADVGVGDTTVVVGVGGIGALALKGARFAGAGRLVAVDPVPGKQEAARKLGADLAYPSMAAALEPLREATQGRMADQVIMAMGEGDGSLLAQALSLVGKQGRVVIVAVHPAEESTASVSLKDLQSMEKQVVGCLGGSWPPRRGILALSELAVRGQLDLADVITRRYALDELSQGYADQAAGLNLRGVVTSF
jgi:S-(hydroxymethyl)glutathione dehydrogenase/alcohol dehydrogenase